MDDYRAKQEAKAVAAKALQAANPHLIANDGSKPSRVIAAKNLRIELKRAFPGVKFSVTTDSYSGGDSMNVSWTDGPTASQVDEIADSYQGSDFDGMQDLSIYRQNTWIDAFGEAKYVFCNRQYSDSAIESAIRTVKAKWAGNLSARNITEISVEDFRAGKLWQVSVMDNSAYGTAELQSLINKELCRRTWSLNKSPKQVEMVEESEAA